MSSQALKLTDVVGEGAFEAVEDEPALLPGLDLAPHLDQVAFAHLLAEDELVAGVHAVARPLHVGAQVQLLLPDGEVARHRTGLGGGGQPGQFHLGTPPGGGRRRPLLAKLAMLALTDLGEVLGPHLHLLLHQLLPVEAFVLQPPLRLLPPPALLLQQLPASHALPLLQEQQS